MAKLLREAGQGGAVFAVNHGFAFLGSGQARHLGADAPGAVGQGVAQHAAGVEEVELEVCFDQVDTPQSGFFNLGQVGGGDLLAGAGGVKVFAKGRAIRPLLIGANHGVEVITTDAAIVHAGGRRR